MSGVRGAASFVACLATKVGLAVAGECANPARGAKSWEPRRGEGRPLLSFSTSSWAALQLLQPPRRARWRRARGAQCGPNSGPGPVRKVRERRACLRRNRRGAPEGGRWPVVPATAVGRQGDRSAQPTWAAPPCAPASAAGPFLPGPCRVRAARELHLAAGGAANRWGEPFAPPGNDGRFRDHSPAEAPGKERSADLFPPSPASLSAFLLSGPPPQEIIFLPPGRGRINAGAATATWPERIREGRAAATSLLRLSLPPPSLREPPGREATMTSSFCRAQVCAGPTG